MPGLEGPGPPPGQGSGPPRPPSGPKLEAPGVIPGAAGEDGPLYTLAIDVGGSGLKAGVLDARGRPIGERVMKTPHPAPPGVVLEALVKLIEPLPRYDRVSVGFPGVVRAGKVLTAPNLETEDWRGFDLAGALAARLGKPVRVLNDAEVQGLGAIRGEGLEMVITLGTGFGTGLFLDGRPTPHLELAHHPFRRGRTYEEQLGDKALKKVGPKKWNRRLRRAIASLRALVNFDRLYLGGGNARHVDFTPDPDTEIVSNEAGILGGVWLWREGYESGHPGEARVPDRPPTS